MTDKNLKFKWNWIDWLFMGTIIFFGLSLIHISFALIGIVCAVTPLVMRAKGNMEPMAFVRFRRGKSP